MRGSIWFIFSLFYGQDLVRCIRIQELRVPAHVAVGGEALLGCQFDLGDDLLYAVKWYKDGKEIFRYMPHNQPDLLGFNGRGVTVDLSRSSSDVVTLTNIQPDSAGVYRCEVTGEAPSFVYDIAEKYVTVHVLPKRDPKAVGLKYEYKYGDYVIANCTAGGSNPEAVVNWLINNKPVHRNHLRGPWRKPLNDTLNTVEVTLGLRFMVLPSNYRNDIMEIKCQATIAPLYQREVLFIFNSPELEVESDPNPDLNDFVEPTIQSLIPSLDSKEDYPPPDDEDEYIPKHANQFHDYLESENLPVTTKTPESLKDHATLSQKSLEAMVISLLIQVMLL